MNDRYLIRSNLVPENKEKTGANILYAFLQCFQKCYKDLFPSHRDRSVGLPCISSE